MDELISCKVYEDISNTCDFVCALFGLEERLKVTGNDVGDNGLVGEKHRQREKQLGDKGGNTPIIPKERKREKEENILCACRE